MFSKETLHLVLIGLVTSLAATALVFHVPAIEKLVTGTNDN